MEVADPGGRAGPGASEDLFKAFTTSSKAIYVLYNSIFLFGPEVFHEHWTHWFCQLEVITTIKSKLVF